MDFFAQQARVRGSSRRLVVLFVLAVIAIVAGDRCGGLVQPWGIVPVDGEPAASNVPLLLGQQRAGVWPASGSVRCSAS